MNSGKRDDDMYKATPTTCKRVWVYVCVSIYKATHTHTFILDFKGEPFPKKQEKRAPLGNWDIQ